VIAVDAEPEAAVVGAVDRRAAGRAHAVGRPVRQEVVALEVPALVGRRGNGLDVLQLLARGECRRTRARSSVDRDGPIRRDVARFGLDARDDIDRLAVVRGRARLPKLPRAKRCRRTWIVFQGFATMRVPSRDRICSWPPLFGLAESHFRTILILWVEIATRHPYARCAASSMTARADESTRRRRRLGPAPSVLPPCHRMWSDCVPNRLARRVCFYCERGRGPGHESVESTC
jgi:hypothetical protein